MNAERLRWLRTKLSRIFRRGRHEAALQAEMQFHFDQLVAEFRREGMSEADARFAAQREFGATEVYREQTRDAWRPWAVADFFRSLRFAVRSLARSPGFSLIAIVTLGLGIGANTSMFSVLNGIILKPLPYPQQEHLDRFHRATAQEPQGNFSAADFLELQQAKDGYGDVAAFVSANVSLSDPGRPAEMAIGARVTPNFFSVLGTQIQLGRDFQRGEDVVGRDRVVILSQRTWRTRFGGMPEIVGRTIRVDGEPHVVIGVLPMSFNDWRHLGWVDLFRPLALTAEQASDRRTQFLELTGRRAPNVSPAEAKGFLAHFGARLAKDYPEVNAASTWSLVSLRETVAGENGSSSLAMLVGLSGFVLLIACSNLANLLLARTMARARELAVRAALGASRAQLLRPLIAESLLLAFAGGMCAIFVALWVHDWLAFRSTGDNGEQVIFELSWNVLVWAFAASLVTALAFGIAPALFALRLDLNQALKSGGRGTTGTRGHQRFRQALIVGQFALAMVLLAGAGLMIRGLGDLNNRRGGWQSEHLVSGTILLPTGKYSDAEQINAFHRLVVERLNAVPGVESASISRFTPFFLWRDARKFLVDGQPRPEPGHEPLAHVNGVTPAYFETVGTPLIAGRIFDERDTSDATRVVILSQSTARAFFGDENPIGRRLGQLEGERWEWAEVVGVVSDVETVSPEPGLVSHRVYQPMAQDPRRQNEIAVRTSGVAPAAMLDSIRAVFAELDPDLPVRKLLPADARIERANYQLGVLRDLLTSFAILGLGLASLGIYGVIARTMAQRSGEFAIRLALGACVRDLTRLVLTSGVKLAFLGSAIGVLGAFGVSRLLRAGFPGLQTNSPAILAATTLLLVAVALLACWIPARRAGKVDAMSVLRAE